MVVVTMGKRDVSRWDTGDFVSYYMSKYKILRNDPQCSFPEKVWLVYGAHIKRFLGKLKISNEEYRDFVDWVFSPSFLGLRSNVGFMAIVSYNVWYYYQRVKNQKNTRNVHKPAHIELLRMRDAIDFNKDFFPED